MRFFAAKDKLTAPPVGAGWQQIRFGHSPTDARVANYLGVLLFFGVNGGAFLRYDWAYLQDLANLIRAVGIVLAPIVVAICLVAFLAVHELVHLLALPDGGRSDRTMYGLAPMGVFLVYSGEIGRKELMRCYAAPFIVLLVPCALPAMLVPGLFSFNLAGMHLATCLGDIVMYCKLARRPDISSLWNGPEGVWVKFAR